MFLFSRFPFLRLCIFLILGILAEIHGILSISLFTTGVILGVIPVLYLGSFLFLRKRINLIIAHTLLGGLALCFIFFAGTFIVQLSHKPFDAHLPKNTSDKKERFYVGEVVKEVEEKDKSSKTVLSIRRWYNGTNWIDIDEKIMLYIKKETKNNLTYGDIILMKGKLEALRKPSNPGEWDYATYLSYQHIFYQSRISSMDYKVVNRHSKRTILGISLDIRACCDRLLKKVMGEGEEYQIASAMILGTRNSLDPSTKQAYTAAGAMHVLAISGLHVAVIFQLLTLFLKKSVRLSKKNERKMSIIVIVFLWAYAFITGLSASVLRAVVMFTFTIIAQAMRRESTSYNNLGLSAFCLLLYDPYLIMDVGFQLSYIAVFGIVFFYYRIYALIDCHRWVIDQVWSMTCVSIAAQLTTFPLTVFYFHQFPTYGIIANIIIIPLSSLVLYMGLATLAVGWIPYVGYYMGFLLKKIITLLNQCAYLTERIPLSLIQSIQLDVVDIILLYLILFFIMLFIMYKPIRYFYYTGILSIYLLMSSIYWTYSFKTQKIIIVYHIPGHFAMELIEGEKGILIADSLLLEQPKKIQMYIRPFEDKKRITSREYISENKLTMSSSLVSYTGENSSILVWHSQKIVFFKHIDTTELKKHQNIIFDLAIVRSQKIENTNLLNEHMSIRKIILASCQPLHRLDFVTHEGVHDLYKSGAYWMDL